MSTRVYIYPEYAKRIKLISGLIKHMNAYINQIIQQVLSTQMELEQDMPMPREDDNVSDNFGPNEDEKFRLEE